MRTIGLSQIHKSPGGRTAGPTSARLCAWRCPGALGVRAASQGHGSMEPDFCRDSCSALTPPYTPHAPWEPLRQRYRGIITVRRFKLSREAPEYIVEFGPSELYTPSFLVGRGLLKHERLGKPSLSPFPSPCSLLLFSSLVVGLTIASSRK